MAQKKITTTDAPTLPYKPIGDIAGARQRREFATRSTETFVIDLNIIRVREGFNVRLRPSNLSEIEWEEHLLIPELAASILTNGLQTPIEGDLAAGGKKFYITEGYRRYLAIKRLVREGNTEYEGSRK